jgi:hypothetical protein
VAQLGRRSMVAVARPRGRWWRQRGRRGVGHWCRACGGEARGGRWSEMAALVKTLVQELAARWTAVPRAPHSG